MRKTFVKYTFYTPIIIYINKMEYLSVIVSETTGWISAKLDMQIDYDTVS